MKEEDINQAAVIFKVLRELYERVVALEGVVANCTQKHGNIDSITESP